MEDYSGSLYAINLAVGVSCLALSAYLVATGERKPPAAAAAAARGIDARAPAAAAPLRKTKASTSRSSSTSPSRSTSKSASRSTSSKSTTSIRSCCWEMKTQRRPSIGAAAATVDVYYLNTDTGEVAWDKPDDYVVAAAMKTRRRLSLAPVTGDTTLREGFELLDIFGVEAQREVAEMRSGATAGEKCLMRLRYLDDLFQNARDDEEEEWFAAIRDDDYALAAAVYGYLCPNCPPDVRLAVCRLLDRMCKLEDGIGNCIVTERWGKLSFLLGHVSSGIEHALSLPKGSGGDEAEEARMQALFAWFLLIEELFSATFVAATATTATTTATTTASTTATAATAADERLPDAVLPGASFFDPILRAMGGCTERVFLAACEACLAINYHYASRATNPFMAALMATEHNQHFGEALLFILNQQSAPYDNGPLLRQALRCIADLFSAAETDHYLYTNDVRAVVDIFVREIVNLDSKDCMRTDYLRALSLLLRHSTWAANGSHRRKELKNALQAILSLGGGEDGYEATAVATVKIVLAECHALLEGD
jgi:hypothetical protein